MKFQICVSGAAAGPTVEAEKDNAYALGREIAKRGQSLLTGATVGLPHYAAHGAKSADGQSVGISPAATKVAHVQKYRLPVGCYDTILFTGLHYIGRDVLLIASADAVLYLGGRIGTLHEFTVALEMHKPVGILTDTGGTTDLFDDILKAAGIGTRESIIFDDDPKRLVRRVIEVLEQENKEHKDIYETTNICEPIDTSDSKRGG